MFCTKPKAKKNSLSSFLFCYVYSLPPSFCPFPISSSSHAFFFFFSFPENRYYYSRRTNGSDGKKIIQSFSYSGAKKTQDIFKRSILLAKPGISLSLSLPPLSLPLSLSLSLSREVRISCLREGFFPSDFSFLLLPPDSCVL